MLKEIVSEEEVIKENIRLKELMAKAELETSNKGKQNVKRIIEKRRIRNK